MRISDWSSDVCSSDLEGFIRTARGWLHPRHVMPSGEARADPVAIAEQLTGAPYLWGGRAGDGLDCSGLVQLSLGLCGIFAPRDSDQQAAALGKQVAAGDLRSEEHTSELQSLMRL